MTLFKLHSVMAFDAAFTSIQHNDYIHSLNKYLLSAYYVPGTVPGTLVVTGKVVMKKKIATLLEVYIM